MNRPALKGRPKGFPLVVAVGLDNALTGWSPLQGDHVSDTYPGLKPWAIFSDHFMVKNRLDRASI
jgi:hypothetical protein